MASDFVDAFLLSPFEFQDLKTVIGLGFLKIELRIEICREHHALYMFIYFSDETTPDTAWLISPSNFRFLLRGDWLIWLYTNSQLMMNNSVTILLDRQ